MLTNINGAIFDLDGTLVDSMWVWSKIDVDYLKSKGYNAPKDLKNEISHLSFTQTAVYIKEKFKLADSVEEMLQAWHDMAFDHYANNVKLKSGVKEFFNYLKSKKIKIALATSNSMPLLEACLKNNGIYNYFDSITTTDEVSNGKNCPDVYLLAAKKLKVKPKNCLVFEDILPAMQGAKAANMKVVAVQDDECTNSKEELLEYADIYINSFLDLL
ncbi:HAD family phosphatase [Clostridium sp. YIM B02555]|jgi:HAD superfamily hydrolase (TIGR01509 family)|uniref:HAD family hydrolase n=1 Tax=Clostridium sp. YIM B02555 TaxID=2911968 RepID=UPI001EEE1AF0|nr:HAD family phosphatase [Clostridium sp. YIM B02555]